MKKILSYTVSSLISTFAICQGRVVAKIDNFKNDKGVCRACLFNNAESFKGESGSPFKCEAVVVKDQSTKVVFNVPAGTYALFVFHDVNGNNKLDKNFIGIPKEGYGSSMNKLPFAGAPTFEDNKFLVAQGNTVTLHIRLRNL